MVKNLLTHQIIETNYSLFTVSRVANRNVDLCEQSIADRMIRAFIAGTMDSNKGYKHLITN